MNNNDMRKLALKKAWQIKKCYPLTTWSDCLVDGYDLARKILMLCDAGKNGITLYFEKVNGDERGTRAYPRPFNEYLLTHDKLGRALNPYNIVYMDGTPDVNDKKFIRCFKADNLKYAAQ